MTCGDSGFVEAARRSGVSPVEVLSIVRALEARSLFVWIAGGWGVDALLGEMTRFHEDLDLVVELSALLEVQECLGFLGFAVEENYSPVRVVLGATDHRQVDLHPVTFASDGTGWQAGAAPNGSDCPYPPEGFASGRILDQSVPCLSPELQLAHHSGYLPRDRDRQDMTRLACRFHLALPDTY